MPSNKLRTKLYFFSCHGAASNYPSLEKADRGRRCVCTRPWLPCRSVLVRCVQAIPHAPVGAAARDSRGGPLDSSRHRALRARIKAENEALRAEQERIRETKRALQQEEEKARLKQNPPKEIVRCRTVRAARVTNVRNLTARRPRVTSAALRAFARSAEERAPRSGTRAIGATPATRKPPTPTVCGRLPPREPSPYVAHAPLIYGFQFPVSFSFMLHLESVCRSFHCRAQADLNS